MSQTRPHRKPLWLALLLTAATAVTPGLQASSLEPLVVCARPNEGFLASSAEGQPGGVEYDLLASFAQSQQRELELVWVDSFTELLPGVIAGSCDIGSSAVTITEERSQIVAFSTPYFPVRTVLAEPRDRPPLALEDLAEETIAAVAGTTHVAQLHELGVTDLLEVTDDEALFRAVTEGKARALACDSSLVARFLEHYPQLRVGVMLSDPSYFAFALRLDSPLVEELDAHLVKYRDSGLYRASIARHFGEEFASFLLD